MEYILYINASSKIHNEINQPKRNDNHRKLRF